MSGRDLCRRIIFFLVGKNAIVGAGERNGGGVASYKMCIDTMIRRVC